MKINLIYIIELIVVVVLMLLSPTLLFIASFLSVLFSEKTNKRYLIIFIFSHIFLAYTWVPWNNSFDLVRHHQKLLEIQMMGRYEIVNNIFTIFAPISFLISYLVSLTNDKNLLQAGVTMFTFCFTFLPVYYYSNKYDLSKKNKNIVFLIVYFSLPVLRVVSGLWSLLSISYFSFILLLKKEGYIVSKFTTYSLLYLSTLIHFGSIIPLFLYVLFDFLRLDSIKKQILSFTVLVISMILILPISKYIYNLTGIKAFYFMGSRFVAYVFEQDKFAYLNNYRFIIVEISKSVLVLGYLYILKTKDARESWPSNNLFAVYISMFTIIFGLFIRILLRFTLLSILISIPYFSKVLKMREENSVADISILNFYQIGFLILNSTYLFYALYNAKMILR